MKRLGFCLLLAGLLTPPLAAAQRIVSLAPNLTELLFELGLGDRVVGVTVYCTRPPEALEKEKVGDFIHPNLEKIVSLAPDLVVAEHWPSSRTVASLKRLGLNVFEPPSPHSFSQIYALIRSLGAAVGREGRARELVSGMKARVEAVAGRGRLLARRPAIYIEIDLPSWTVGRRSFITEGLRLCGARNIFEDVSRPSLQASREAILARNPDVIITFTGSAAEVARRPGWSQITAVQEGRIIDDFDQDLLSRGNHRLVEALESLQARLLEWFR